MGDEAESVFEQTIGKRFIRFGLNRPDIDVRRIPARLRYTPDYLTAPAFYEVQGCGADETIKLKLDKWQALHYWNDVHPVRLFFWNNKQEQFVDLTLDDVTTALNRSDVALNRFREGKAYFAIPWSVLNAPSP